MYVASADYGQCEASAATWRDSTGLVDGTGGSSLVDTAGVTLIRDSIDSLASCNCMVLLCFSYRFAINAVNASAIASRLNCCNTD
jgi:hypothetical protein